MKYATKKDYADLCGVSKQAIHDRIARNTLTTVTIPGPDGKDSEYIDCELYPPKSLFGVGRNGRKKKIENK